MFGRLQTLITGTNAQRNWRNKDIAGYRVHAKVMGDSLPKIEIYDGDELVYHKSRSDIPVQKIPSATAQSIINQLLNGE